MNRSLVVVALMSLACSRSTPAARPVARPVARPHVEREAERGRESLARFEEGEAEEIMNPVRDLSPYPDTAEGLQTYLTELTRAAIRHDQTRLATLHARLDPDRDRVELALTFEAARRLTLPALGAISSQRAAFEAALGALREPVQVRVVSALGRELATDARGMNPALASAHASLRPSVRYFRVEVQGEGGASVVVEPMAFLGGQWTFLGDAWNTAAPTVPSTPGARPGVTAN